MTADKKKICFLTTRRFLTIVVFLSPFILFELKASNDEKGLSWNLKEVRGLEEEGNLEDLSEQSADEGSGNPFDKINRRIERLRKILGMNFKKLDGALVRLLSVPSADVFTNKIGCAFGVLSPSQADSSPTGQLAKPLRATPQAC